MSNTVTVVCAALFDLQGRVLMTKRKPGGMRPNMWEYPGGKVEASDASLEAALQRELIEELGIIVHADADFQIASTFTLEYELGAPCTVIVYTVPLRGATPRCLDASALEMKDLRPALKYEALLPSVYMSSRSVITNIDNYLRRTDG